MPVSKKEVKKSTAITPPDLGESYEDNVSLQPSKFLLLSQAYMLFGLSNWFLQLYFVLLPAIKMYSQNIQIPQITIEISKLTQVSRLYTAFPGVYIKILKLFSIRPSHSQGFCVVLRLPYIKAGFLYAAFFVLKKILKKPCCYC